MRYAGARDASRDAVELLSDEPTRIGGRTFKPGVAYAADDPLVMRNRKHFRVIDSVTDDAPKPEPLPEPTETLADPDE